MEEINNTQNLTSQPSISETPAKNNNTYKYLFFISIVILIGVIIGFYFVLNSKINRLEDKQIAQITPTTEEISSTPNKTETITTTSTKEITPTTSVNINTSNDWQTYTNSNYGFSFNYPSNWAGQSNKTTSGGLQHLFQFDISPEKSFFKNYLGASVNIMLIGYQGSPADWYKDNIDLGPFTKQSSTGSIYESKNLTINGYQTFYVKQTNDSYTDNSYVISNGKKYILYVNFRESEKHYSTSGVVDKTNDYTQYLTVFNQVVNSIKFN